MYARSKQQSLVWLLLFRGTKMKKKKKKKRPFCVESAR
tara:strand:+ start:223 stop:336 length:114 start_codon:yes stop_codon:yes gene_type:complete